MNTKQSIEINEMRRLAAKLNIGCTIESYCNDTNYSIVMDTGEIESVIDAVQGCRVLYAYAGARGNQSGE